MARGTFHLMIAEGMFVLSGWAIHIGAGNILGKSFYGIFVILLSLLTHYRIFLATGVNRAVSKYISEQPAASRAIRRQALKLQVTLGCALCVLIWLVAPSLARLWQNADLTGYIRLTGFFFPVFGIYSVYRGSLNGLKLFGREARVSILYSLLKVGFLFALIFHYGIYGAISGYLAAIIGATLLARFICPGGEKSFEKTFPLIKIISFAFPVVLFSFIISLIQHVDLYFIRGMIPADLTDQATSYYGCAQQFSKIPYMILYALSLTVFPNIASSTSRAGNEHITAGTIRKSLRAGLLIVLPVAALIGASAPDLIDWIYPRIAGGGEALRILIFGQTFLSCLFILAMILTASGRPWPSFILVASTLIIDVLLNYLLVPLYSIRGAAAATTISSALGMLIAGVLVFHHFRSLISPLSALKIIIVSLLVYGLTHLLNPTGWAIPPVFLLLSGLYLLLLLLTREIDSSDWKMLKSLFKREIRNSNI